jgi:hypothetical protein
VTKVPPAPYKPPKGPPPLSPQPAVSVDAELCPESPSGCSFIFPGFIIEQESKAQMHLYELGLLALALNRTLVLPLVGGSRMNACEKRHFDFYYAPDALERYGIPSITYQDFIAWANSRIPRPHGQIVNLLTIDDHHRAGAVQVETAVNPSASGHKRHLCLGVSKLAWGNWSPITVYPPHGWERTTANRQAFVSSLIETFNSGDVGRRSFRGRQPHEDGGDGGSSFSKADVLVFDYEITHSPLLDPGVLPSGLRTVSPFSHLAYSPALVALASHIAHTFSPFVLVHWRQEEVPVDHIPGCAQGLIDKLDRLAGDWPELRAVYLATDYPLESIDSQSRPAAGSEVSRHSDTFKDLAETHHSSMRIFLSAFDDTGSRLGGKLKLVTYSRLVRSGELARSLPRALREAFPEDQGGVDFEAIDKGLVSIMDKLIAIEANVLLVGEQKGSQQCGRRGSKFTKHIVQEREKKGKLKNTVERWGNADIIP